MPRYVSLGRVSTDKQGQNLSKEVQFDAIRAYADAQLWGCVGEFFDVASGSEAGVEDRESLRQALAMLENKQADYLVMYDVTRMGREAKVIQDLINNVYKLGGRLGVATERRLFATASEAQELLYWQGATSAWEYLQIKKRTSRGKKKAFEMGGFIWKPLFGYSLTTKDKTKTLIVNQQEALVICRIFDEVIAGKSKANIAAWCQSIGHSINAARVTKIINDAEVYAGGSRLMTITIDGEKFERYVQFPRIIDEQTYEDIENIPKITYTKSKEPTPYLGVIDCHCGGTGSLYVSAKNKKGKRRVQIACSTVVRGRVRRGRGKDPGPICKHSLAERFITEEVVAFLHTAVDYIARDWGLVQHIDVNEDIVQRIEAELTAIEDKRSQILTQLTGDVSKLTNIVEVLDKELGRLKEQEVEHRRELDTYQRMVERDRRILEKLQAIEYNTITDKIFQALTDENWLEVNRLMNEVGIRIRIDFDSPKPLETLTIRLRGTY